MTAEAEAVQSIIRLGLLYGMKRKDEIIHFTYPATKSTIAKDTSYQHRYSVLREDLAAYLMAILEVEGSLDQNLKTAEVTGIDDQSPGDVDAGQA